MPLDVLNFQGTMLVNIHSRTGLFMRTALLVLMLTLTACADDGIPASSPLPTSGATLPPAQWLKFCQQHPEYQPCMMTNP